jgi:hypothetical protein
MADQRFWQYIFFACMQLDVFGTWHSVCFHVQYPCKTAHAAAYPPAGFDQLLDLRYAAVCRLWKAAAYLSRMAPRVLFLRGILAINYLFIGMARLQWQVWKAVEALPHLCLQDSTGIIALFGCYNQSTDSMCCLVSF